ncbi:MAG: tRNA (adenosine(37)-N6)-dimethylallyltransferase MiaA, partial [Nitrospirae bacterium]
MAETEKRVIVLLGPTASGKTSLSILIAKALKTEIISADSMQIYRGMDIGTAKPTKEQLTQVPHHMIDIVEPSERFSVGQYIRAVVPIIERLHSEGKIPLVVGGTGLYIRAMTKGLFEVPQPPQGLREKLKEIAKEDPQSLFTELQKLDPEKAEELNPTDLRRIIRALEVIFTTGRAMSDLQKNLTRRFPYEFIKIGITRDRKELYKLIEP